MINKYFIAEAKKFQFQQIKKNYPITNHINWGFRQKPSNIQKSRENVPDISLIDSIEFAPIKVRINF